MIGYVTVGTNDLAKATAFYDALFAAVDVTQLWAMETQVGWGMSFDTPAFCVTKPFDEKDASVGNGMMIALKLTSKKHVDAMHGAAMSLGGEDEGAPGPRGDGDFYCGYFRDLDGNKINAYFVG